MLLLTLVAHAAEPHPSYAKQVTANGYGVAVMNGGNSGGTVLDVFSDHLYQQYSAASEPTRDLLHDTYFGIRTDQGHGWLTDAAAQGVVPGTNVLWVDRSTHGLEITEWVVAPMAYQGPVIVHVLEVHNPGDAAVDATLYSLHNFQLGDTSSENERIGVSGDGLYEQGEGSGLRMDYLPLVPATRSDCSPNNPYYAVGQGWDLDACTGGVGDDVVGAFQWDVSVPAGDTRWVGVVDAFGGVAGPVDAWVDGRGPQALVQAELDGWDDWHAQGTAPEGLSDAELQVYLQALAFLRMGQVREDGDAYGQILASLPLSAPVGEFTHIWNIAWVRDGAYGIRGLTAAGHYAEARDALSFQVQPGKTGDWVSYVGGADHALSICRIYGNGDEWTDVDETGPNIEFDNFGLWLWAAGEYVRASGDRGFINEHHAAIFEGTADVLVRLIEPTTGLITADSSIWEEHWNGNQKHFTYTSAWAVRGLREASEMAALYGDTERAETYAAEADALAQAIATELTRNGVLASSLEELQANAPMSDLAAIDAFNNGALPIPSESFDASMAAWERDLGLASGPGFMRNDDGDLYDSYEWLMIDLRVAEAYRRACRPDDAAEIEAWVTDMAQANHLIIPELLHPDTADYSGPAPMMGFGSGLYVLQLHARAELDPACDGDTADTASDTGGPGARRCGCGGGAVPGGLLSLLFAAALIRRRS